MTTYFTRLEFYELVWSKPVTHLANQFGLSDVAIHKICRQHNIPTPPRGWWAERAVGKGADKTPLPPVAESGMKIAITSNEFRKESSSLTDVREKARVDAAVAIPAPVLPPHPIVERTLKALRAAKLEENGLACASGSNVIKCSVSPKSIDRLAMILPRVMQAASVQGFTLENGTSKAVFTKGPETLGFSILEQTRRFPHELTPAERKKVDDHRENRRKNPNAFLWGPFFEKWDMRPIGQLGWEFEHVQGPGNNVPRRCFNDGKLQKLETMAEEIAVGMAVLLAAKAAEKLEQEQLFQKREIMRREREYTARQKYIGERRLKALTTILSELDELEKFRQLMSRLESVPLDGSQPRLVEFMNWARANLTKREKELNSSAMEERFAWENVFGQDDDSGFKPSQSANDDLVLWVPLK